MTVRAILEVSDRDTLGSVRGLLKSLFVNGVLDALLVPVEVPSADRIAPKLVKEPEQLENANPLAPVMRMNSASLVARMRDANGAERLGAVLRPCELRAVIELAKAGRVDLDQYILISIDCMGTYECEAYAQIARASLYRQSPTDEMLRWTRQGPIAPYRLRGACQICERFVPENADISIGLIGLNVRERLSIEMREDIADKISLPSGDAERREKAISRMTAIRRHRRDEALAKASELLTDLPSLLALLAPCTACFECLYVCPLHTTHAFKPARAKESGAVDRVSLPSGEGWMGHEHESGPLGELIEFGRRAISCVGCGMCEAACPNHVPLTALQGALARKVREEFGYVPGRSVNERLPWATTGQETRHHG
jgi:formate dehydrogenase (coenzyme F420) beta subunit